LIKILKICEILTLFHLGQLSKCDSSIREFNTGSSQHQSWHESAAVDIKVDKLNSHFVKKINCLKLFGIEAEQGLFIARRTFQREKCCLSLTISKLIADKEREVA
jgi:hypothetical protein